MKVYLGPLGGRLADGHHRVVERAGLPDLFFFSFKYV